MSPQENTLADGRRRGCHGALNLALGQGGELPARLQYGRPILVRSNSFVSDYRDGGPVLDGHGQPLVHKSTACAFDGVGRIESPQPIPGRRIQTVKFETRRFAFAVFTAECLDHALAEIGPVELPGNPGVALSTIRR